MTTERPSLAERFEAAGILPHQREAAGVSVVLCELVDELVTATTRQNTLLHRVLTEQSADRAGQTRGAGQRAGASAPSGPAEGDPEGGASVQLREPAVPPPDPDEATTTTGTDARDRAVAEQTTAAGKPGRPPARKATAKKAAVATKAAPAAEAKE